MLLQNFEGILKSAAEEFSRITPETWIAKPQPNIWSKQEILGHLVDSAYNNHQRFLRAPGQGDLRFPGYDQDEWVRRNGYQNRPSEEVI
ncbi:MAG: DinB family protein, partial [Bacteroidota bacterium]